MEKLYEIRELDETEEIKMNEQVLIHINIFRIFSKAVNQNLQLTFVQ